MFKDVLNYSRHFTHYAEVGLIIFFVVFAGVSIQALRRSKQDISDWSRLPLDE